MTTLKTWMEEALEDQWLKLDEGVHTITILGDPEEVRSELTGKPQMVFECEIDGEKGKFAPSKKLLRIVAAKAIEEQNKYPITFQVNRTGLDIKTKYTLV